MASPSEELQAMAADPRCAAFFEKYNMDPGTWDVLKRRYLAGDERLRDIVQDAVIALRRRVPSEDTLLRLLTTQTVAVRPSTHLEVKKRVVNPSANEAWLAARELSNPHRMAATARDFCWIAESLCLIGEWRWEDIDPLLPELAQAMGFRSMNRADVSRIAAKSSRFSANPGPELLKSIRRHLKEGAVA